MLFGDLVGFTPLSESKDAEEVRELLSAYFAQCRVIVRRYGGVVEKFIGDAVMAVWGVPVAHEDDAERAVRAGLELAAATAAMGGEVGAPGLAMRVGIVTREVAVTLGATAEGMVVEDAVNTAARVQSAAEPGRVWVDDATRSLASAAITFTDTGEHPLKGKADSSGCRRPTWWWPRSEVVSESTGWRLLSPGGAPTFAWSRTCSTAPRSRVDPGSCSWTVRPGSASPGWRGSSRSTSTGWRRGSSGTGDVASPTATGVAFWAWREAMRARFGLVEADTGETVNERLRSRVGRVHARRGRSRLAATAAGRAVGRGRRVVASRGRTCSRRGRRSSSISARRARWSCSWSTTLTMPTRACWTSWTTSWQPPRRRSSSLPWPARAAGATSGVGWAAYERGAPRLARRGGHGQPRGRAGGGPSRRLAGGPGGPGRRDPVVRRGDGAGVDRPRPRRPPGRTIRRRRGCRPGPRRDRRTGVAAGPGRRPSRCADHGRAEGRRRRQRPGRVLHRRGPARAGHGRRTSRACWSRCAARRS